jgi:cysteine-rich repeat protein
MLSDGRMCVVLCPGNLMKKTSRSAPCGALLQSVVLGCLTLSLVACGSSESGTSSGDDTGEEADSGRPIRDVDRNPDLGDDSDILEEGDGDPSGTEPDGFTDGGSDVLDASDGSSTPTDGSSYPDVVTDVETGADTDTGPGTPDVVVPPGCGDGVQQVGEQCDDGNDINTDGCRNDCVRSSCGDGELNSSFGEQIFVSPEVTDLGDRTGYVCDDGATCPESSCDVLDDGYASEHGICQSLGFERASRVVWGDGTGGGAGTSTPRAFNWDCVAYRCIDGATASTTPPCDPYEMLAEITCQGIVGEECDDGIDNADSADACRTDCTLPECGDAIVDSGEECDDANNVEDDGCNNACQLPQCGDGVRQADEECDDGNDDDTDLCRNNCQEPGCGDGVVSTFEQITDFSSPTVTNPFGVTGRVCDDGSACFGSCDVSGNGAAPEHGICQALGYQRTLTVNWGGGAGDSDTTMPHAYNWTCTGFVCGPSTNTYSSDNCSSSEMLNSIRCIRAIDEQCDAGAANSNAPGAPCRTDCTDARCGDRIVDPGETCDDGNTDNTDACTTACQAPFCGDGLVQAVLGEQCDAGAANNDTVANACRTTCVRATCGDRVVDTGELCDDGNRNTNDGCSNNCRTPGCGDGVLQATEECDDGNLVPGDGCSSCLLPQCGDSVVQADFGEQCDNGPANNDTTANACRTDCLNPGCGDGVLDRGEACDDGNTNNADGCSNLCRSPGCGDGAIQREFGEECDDANTVANDGCSNNCLLPQCGDGVRQGTEACDDGNASNGDSCLNSCEVPRCGDGFVSFFSETRTFTSPTVTNPFGVTGRVCDDGASCFTSPCDVSGNGSAPEHGVCQALGFDRAQSVSWGGGAGESDTTMPHAYNWTCTGFACGPSTNDYSSDNCSVSEMLNTITCVRESLEACDEGPANSDAPTASCTTRCSRPGCGDGILQAGEVCDDGDTDNTDACTSLCQAPRCGDGFVQSGAGEQCDLGPANSDAAGSRCLSTCRRPPGFLACEARDLGSSTGASVATGTTIGRANSESGTCVGSGAPDERLIWTAPRAGSFTFNITGPSYDSGIYLRDASSGSCTGTQLACNDDAAGGSSVSVTLASGAAVLIVIDGFGSGAGTWTLAINGP